MNPQRFISSFLSVLAVLGLFVTSPVDAVPVPVPEDLIEERTALLAISTLAEEIARAHDLPGQLDMLREGGKQVPFETINDVLLADLTEGSVAADTSVIVNPEPASLALLLTGLVALVMRRLHRRGRENRATFLP